MKKITGFFKRNWHSMVLSISIGLVLFLIESSIYNFFLPDKWTKFWVAIPCLTFLLCQCIKFFAGKYKNTKLSIDFGSGLAFIGLFINIKNLSFNEWYSNRYSEISFSIILVAFLGIIIFNLVCKKFQSISNNDIDNKRKLFNLFYLNTSKAHEIAMLIDNKVVKNIESEHVSEHTVKNNATLTFKSNPITTDNGISTESLSRQRVFESFDVKETKSIMLRTIYDSVKKIGDSSFSEGNLVLLENVELKQVNVDDTVMILNVLQDSKFNNQDNDNIEINFNKMFDKMLDDFTIDYTFFYPNTNGNEKYLIRLPYKSLDNFENGYQHNDLQLGKLSVIGIYRGEIDFSKVESMSSKFLDLIFKSYNEQKNELIESYKMKFSNSSGANETVEFDFNHERLSEKIRLIDVIAIIQEISFEKDEK